MAVKAKCEITLYRVVDIDKVTRYYLLQSSTATTPSKPTANPPGGNWKTTEPSYTSGSTNTLYFVDLTMMTNGSFSYSAVSKSSSYEAAKEAWNKANNAQNTADNVNGKIDDLQIGGRNLWKKTQAYDALNDSFWTDANNNVRVQTTAPYDTVNGFGVQRISSAWIDITQRVPIEKNTYYTLSAYIKWEDENNKAIIAFFDNYSLQSGTQVTSQVGTTEYKRVSMTFNSGDGTYSTCRFECFTNTPYLIYGYKLEKGNKATDWTPAPEDTEEKIETARKDAAKTATNYLKGSEDGLVVGNMTSEILGSNVLINPDSVNIRDGDTILARYSEKKIELGLNSEDAVIELCNGVGTITSRDRNKSGYNNSLSISSESILLEKATYIRLITDALGSDIPELDENQCYSNITSSAYASDNDNKWATIGLGTRYKDTDEVLSAGIACSAYKKDRASLACSVVGGNNKETEVLIHHNSKYDDSTSRYEGIEIRSTDVIKIRSNLPSNANRDFSIGVGIGAGGINRGIHDRVNNHWMLYCDTDDMYFQAPKTSKIKPYYRAGDSIQLYYQGAGFATSNGNYVVFTIPINKPIDASNVFASSVSGFIGRSNGKYTHGSASSTYVKPASYEATINGNAVRVSMIFNNNTNVTNNAAIGVTWSGKITFS